jgi:hypothetical protein
MRRTDEMTPQEIFDTIATHLFEQGCQSVKDGMCLYRTDSGLKCAVGILIPDEAYDKKMDDIFGQGDTSIRSLILSGLLPSDLQKTFEDNQSLLLDLQWVHDQNYNWNYDEDLKYQLEIVAANHKLDYSVLSKLSFKGN